jgi:DhnA family fructose-bisphosphate aldolase class Ia
LLNQRFRAIQTRFSRMDDLSPYFDEESEGWRRSQDSIRRIAGQARERGVPMLLVVYLWLSNELDDASYPYTDVHAKLRRLASEIGIQFLDARPTRAEKSVHARDWWARPFDFHPGGGANRRVAQAIATRLIAEGALHRASVLSQE